MFVKEKKYEDIERLIIKNKIPLLINYKPFKDTIINNKGIPHSIKEKYEELKILVAKKVSSEKKIVELQNKKPKIMAKIIYISQKINDNEKIFNEDELEKLKEEMNDTNLKLEESFDIVENLIIDVRTKNVELLRECLKYSYSTISTDEEKLKDVDKVVIKLRKKLDELREEKEFLETEMNSIYSFIHGIVGYKDVEKLDNKFLK